ncbi:MAG: TetR/AcrR family transcriptional regulator [Pseudoclavibacter sp.]
MPAPASDRPYHHGNLRASLLEAAERYLVRGGADRLSLRDLARDVGVSHGAPRRHFADRQAVLDALAIIGFERLHEALLAARDGAGDGATADIEARIRAVAAAYTRFAAEHAALLELMYASKHRPEATAVLDAVAGPFGLMNDLIMEGQESGMLRQGDPDRLGLVIFAPLQGIASITVGGIIEPGQIDELTTSVMDVFLRGVRP